MTPREFWEYAEQAIRRLKLDTNKADQRVALICCTLANIHRDPRRRPRPWAVEDFMPKERQKAQTPDEMYQVLLAVTIASGGTVDGKSVGEGVT